ncbi:M23 family metallopeptidase [Tepidamorphus sp. 3E244]|uniref:M23 family metallopeptidase n=1 Tax=Tepidamorphus sp. 3E244 TaxID=3385498 RepID=UPI0038FC089F
MAWAVFATAAALGSVFAVANLGLQDDVIPANVKVVSVKSGTVENASTTTRRITARVDTLSAPVENPQVAGLRLRIDDTLASSPVSAAVNEIDARLYSLIARHDRLTATADDLEESGIIFKLAADDLVPSKVAPLNPGKPQVLDTANANRMHPLYGFVRDVRAELATALRDEKEPALKRIEILNARLDALAIRQFGVLDRMEKEVEGRHSRLASVPRALGITVPGRGHDSTGQGGPMVPLLSGTSAAIYAFETRIEGVELTLARLSDIGHIVNRLPVRRPVGANASISSGFGPRVDPFLGKPAMHQGLDFRARRGEQVAASGAGKIVRAGRLGGYGKVVEIDHGEGLVTRYAHLSKIDVKLGDTVAPGDPIGKVGSTGRSTGPHLHFEVRRNGNARNPLTYIRAGRRLDS